MFKAWAEPAKANPTNIEVYVLITTSPLLKRIFISVGYEVIL
jgi:hypothetical protein